MTSKITLAASAAAAVLVSGIAYAEPSYQVDVGIGYWGNEDGGNGMYSNGGIDGKDDRLSGKLGFSVAMPFANGWTGEFEFNSNYFTPASQSLDNDDATQNTVDTTLHAFRDFNGVTVGGFFGFGLHDDYGDSDGGMGYRYAGLEAWKDFGAYDLYGQIGMLDSYDEYDEGTRNAGFINVGGSYAFNDITRMTGALGFSRGDKYSSDYQNSIYNVKLGVERDFGKFTGVAGYEWTQISYKDGSRYGDTFNELYVGLRMNFGGSATHAPDLPSFGKWVAYNANEIE